MRDKFSFTLLPLLCRSNIEDDAKSSNSALSVNMCHSQNRRIREEAVSCRLHRILLNNLTSPGKGKPRFSEFRLNWNWQLRMRALFCYVSLCFTMYRCDFFALLIFIVARFGLFRLHLVSVQDPKPKFLVSRNKPKQLGISVICSQTKTKKVFHRTPYISAFELICGW